MKIVELNDERIIPIYIEYHLLDCKDYYFIHALIEGEIRNFLIWPGGEIKLRRAMSNKRLGKLKIKNVELSKDMCRCLVGSYFESKDNSLSLIENDEDSWTLYYNSKLDIRIVDEIMCILSRLKA